MRHTITSIVLAIISTLIFGLSKAEAYPVTIEIEAVVDFVEDEDNYLEGQISVDDIITGYYTYESTTEDSDKSSPSIGLYEHHASPSGIFISVSGFDFETNTENVDFLVEIINDYTSGGLQDNYVLGSSQNLTLSNNISVELIKWVLCDYSANALKNDSLPTIPPILSDWEENNLQISGERNGYTINAHVTSAIPEPSTILLIGLGALMFRKRK